MRMRSNIFGSILMIGFASYSGLRWLQTGYLFFVLLFIKNLAVAFFLLKRRNKTSSKESLRITFLSYLSSAIPVFYLRGSLLVSSNLYLFCTLVTILGYTLSTLSLFDLGYSFGISPAKRDLVRSGVYKYLNHPMYLGYGISEFPFILIQPLNGILYLLSISLYFFRAREESFIHRKSN